MTESKLQESSLKKDLAFFESAFGDLRKKIYEIGVYVCNRLRENPTIDQHWSAHIDIMTPGMILALRRIGQGSLLPEIFLAQNCTQKLLTAPIDVQKQVLEKGIPVAQVVGSRINVVYRRIEDLKPREASLALKEGGLRPIPEQENQLKARLAKEIPKASWEVCKDGIKAGSVLIPKSAIIPIVKEWIDESQATLERDLKMNQVNPRR